MTLSGPLTPASTSLYFSCQTSFPVRSSSKNPSVVATNVLAFDATPSGELVYTNGFALFHRTSDGVTTRLCDDELIERVVLL